MKPRTLVAPLVSLAMLACTGVREADLQAWQGAPASELDLHPIFITVPVIRTISSDGTEIRNYVNGRNTGECTGGGSIVGPTINQTSFSQFMTCMQGFAACNNIFYIKDGRVIRYTPVGTGGMRCYTDERLRPGFHGPTNIH
jgi:hypothetical protein